MRVFGCCTGIEIWCMVPWFAGRIVTSHFRLLSPSSSLSLSLSHIPSHVPFWETAGTDSLSTFPTSHQLTQLNYETVNFAGPFNANCCTSPLRVPGNATMETETSTSWLKVYVEPYAHLVSSDVYIETGRSVESRFAVANRSKYIFVGKK